MSEPAPPTRAERLLAFAAALAAARATGAQDGARGEERRGADDDGGEAGEREAGGVLSDLASWAEQALSSWLVERQRARAGLELGLDRVAVPGEPLELVARLPPGMLPDQTIEFFVDGHAVGRGRTSDLGAAVCSYTPTTLGLHRVSAAVLDTDGVALAPAQPIAHLQVVGDQPLVLADTRLLDADLPSTQGAIHGLLERGLAVCWLEPGALELVADRHARLGDAGLPPAAVLAVDHRTFETLGLDFRMVNARLLVRRLRAAGVPLVAALTGLGDDVAEPGIVTLTVAELTERLASPHGLVELTSAARELVTARNRAAGRAGLARRLDVMTGTTASIGHAISLELDNRAARTALFADLDAATSSIHLQFYILKPGRFATELVERLRARGRAGVAVRLVVDALYAGQDVLGRQNPVVAELLGQPGIEVIASDPISLAIDVDTVTLKQRDHRKLAIIDGAVAYVTGRNGADEYYLGWDEVQIDDATIHDAIPWLDAHARVLGPAVTELEKIFAANWARNGGAPIPAPPPATAAGEVSARVVLHDGISDAHAMACYDALFAGARSRIIVVNDFPLIADLAVRLLGAAQRGVRVDILTGCGLARRGDGTFFEGPRHREVFEYMVKHCYQPLLDVGVRVVEFAAPPAPSITARGGAIRPYVHAKLVVVDDAVISVGTANLDVTASHWEREISLLIESPDLARSLTLQLDAHLARGYPIDPHSEAWRREAPHRLLAGRLWPARLYS